jgi:very-short-patch-repair endonuclease
MAITQEQLDENRHELLDLSARNRLLSLPVDSTQARLVHLHDERSADLLRMLVVERKAFTFVPQKTGRPSSGAPVVPLGQEGGALPQPEGDLDPETGKSRRHTDTRLQTTLGSETLQSRLLGLYRDARTLVEEQGVNTLYLALGQLKWFEAEKPEEARFAPLILIPVELVRAAAGDRFKLRAREEDVQENLSLEAKLRVDLDLQLPPFPEPEDLAAGAYLQAVAEAVRTRPNWEVKPDAITLGLFSFEKFLMYRDLDATLWPRREALLGHPLVASLLGSGFPPETPPFPDDPDLDALIPAEKLDHIVDADASQTFAIEAVRRGRNLVIQGPPGTGKSQSITNLIATAVLDGKTVLFVAQKMAALEVVKRRLEREGLGSLCLELHSEKCQRRAVLQEIATAWRRPPPPPPAADAEGALTRLEAGRRRLNLHAVLLHRPRGPGGLAPFTVIGRLCALADIAPHVAELTLEGAERWTVEERRARREALEALLTRLARVGTPAENPWRGVRREALQAVDRAPLAARITRTGTLLEQAAGLAAETAPLLHLPSPANLAQAEQLARAAGHLAAAPHLDARALREPSWAHRTAELRTLVVQGTALAAAKARLEQQVTAAAWDLDFRAEREVFATHGDSWLRRLTGTYRRAAATVSSVLRGPLPPTPAERLALLDALIAGQRARAALAAGDALGRTAFGSAWSGEASAWAELEGIIAWVEGFRAAGLEDSYRQVFGALEDPAGLAAPAARLAAAVAAAEAALVALASELNLDHPSAFQTKDHRGTDLSVLRPRLATWAKRSDELPDWIQYHLQSRAVQRAGLGGLHGLLESGALAPSQAANALEYLHLSAVFREMTRELPELGEFDGTLHSQLIAEFRSLDTQRLGLAKQRILAGHQARLPAWDGVVGATGVLKGEIERKRGHRSVRRLLRDAGTVVQAIKPVLMMSPLSVARHLEPGSVEFDLLVIDEASQVEPVDALGAIARCRQMVVVGDSRQLPPGRFFELGAGNVPEPGEEALTDATAPRDVESVLGLCLARGLAERMLRWHYRSRHQSLIAVSNQEFYRNQLIIPPSPWREAPLLGVKFHAVQGGVFDWGGTSVNAVETQVVARAVMLHARQRPGESLGVATFGLRQQQAILDALEVLRREQPEAESFFADHKTEPFFVKNLENVQGDERDVIYISVGYAPNAQGRMLMSFGPLGAEGGERRLNVLITRAKLRCEVFSSITAADLDLSRAKGKGVSAFRQFLDFAATGQLASAAALRPATTPEILHAARRALEARGHRVELQVGSAGVFVDLAVADPNQRGHYRLGIEFDGPDYAGSSFARGRDRLRQSALEAQGWSIHRIWSADWLQHPGRQIEEIEAALRRVAPEAEIPAR